MGEESVNFVKPYTKIESSDEDSDSTTTGSSETPSPHRRRTAAAIITLTLFTVIIGSILAAGTRQQKPSDQSTSSSIKATRSIKAVCAVTQNPEICIADITAIDISNFYDPEVIFNLTLTLAVTELVNISALPKTLISKSSDLRSGAALRDCVSLFDDAASQLSKSVEAMEVVGSDRRMLSEEKVEDMKTWISAAMSDQETCLDGLEEMGYAGVDEVRGLMKRSSESMSNSLAILDNMEMILKELGLHLH